MKSAGPIVAASLTRTAASRFAANRYIGQMASAAAAPDTTKTSDIRVLIVDNDQSHAETVAESLHPRRYDCEVAHPARKGPSLSNARRSTS